jgi:hypothetical protein
MVALSHASQAGHLSKGFFIDYCFLICSRMKLADKVNYIRSDWIRPEDLHYYIDLGYDRFKLVERNIPTEFMLKRVRAYTQGRYDGNLLDLVQGYGFQGGYEPRRYFRRGLFWNLKYFLSPFLVNPARLFKIRRLAERQGMLFPLPGKPPVYIDNGALDGFLDFFLTNDCSARDCEACRYCHRFAEKAVWVDPEFREECLRMYDEVLRDLHTGQMWDYRPGRYVGTNE